MKARMFNGKLCIVISVSEDGDWAEIRQDGRTFTVMTDDLY